MPMTGHAGRAWGAIAALLVILLVFAVLRTGHQRASAYRNDVRRDSNYDFTRARPTRVHARLQDGRLVAPARLESQNTVLLEVRVCATLLGHWFEPHVDIGSNTAHITQAFERGGSGLRYINLSPLDLHVPTTVQLRAKYMKIPDQDVTLIYLPSDLAVAKQRILVISPHPDDAEIAAFELYDRHDAYVVTVTSGDSGDAGIFSMFAGKEAFREKGRVRTWNSLVVPMLGGVAPDRVVNLGYFDGTLSAMKADPAKPVHGLESQVDSLDAYRSTPLSDLIASREDTRATWQNLVRDFENVIRKVQPDIIVTPYPLLDQHTDHQMATVALVEALQNLHWTHGALLLYAIHSPVSAMYPYGDAGDVVSLPPVAGVFFDGIWSQTLSAEEQSRKYLALDAMNDIRPNLKPASLRSVASLFKHALISSIDDSDDSYYRRAVRANDLFFEVRISSLYEPGVTQKLLAAPQIAAP